MTKTQLPLTSEDFRKSETFEAISDPMNAPVCAVCGAAVDVRRASRGRRDVHGQFPIVSVECSANTKHLCKHFSVRLD